MAKYELENQEMRKAYSSTLDEMINEDKRVFVLEADLSEAISTNSIAKTNKENYINCGIMEANMIGVASGLSLVGDIPFVHTFSPFATRRDFDQIFLSGAYAKTNIKILGSDPGIYTQHNGGTHTSFEDIALMRTIPTATVLSISDTTMMKNILRQIKDIYGIHYLSAIRKGSYKVYNDDEKFEIGKGKVLREGKDITIIACGIMVVEALKAADILEKEGIDVTVIDMFTIKPIDKELVKKYSKLTKGIVTAENHNIIGGLGSAVAEVIVENTLVPMRRVGVEDRFGQVGTLDYLQKEYKLTAEEIVNKVKELL
ncbi:MULTISPECIES: transketolase family protein [unclassified Fusobacterium]|uniref:transketolase family protein n=1 Tax=Fusobacterium sp. TaxID=68766 RepID=UPI0025B7F482|nr:transketolase C-terminal domain-containing protein [Fusobacterium sp.]